LRRTAFVEGEFLVLIVSSVFIAAIIYRALWSRRVSPIGPTEGGLIGALRDLVSQFKGPGIPSVEISVSEVSRLRLSPAATDHLYRIAQEALANALKHARANGIKVTLDVRPELVRLEIRDDGEGVKIMGADAPGLGLRTMQYRASLIGARFEIARLQPHGTRIICDCPTSGPMGAADLMTAPTSE
jgi:signal transduction histidine kinase